MGSESRLSSRLVTIDDINKMSNPFYTSRSAIECYQTCNRKRWLEYHYGENGKGIRPVRKSISLTTGSGVHTGVGYILRLWLEDRESLIGGLHTYIEYAVGIGVKEYKKILVDTGILEKGIVSEDQVLFKVHEQCALTEALIRVWCLVELPNLLKYFDILHTEKEMYVELEMGSEIINPSRVDAILISKPLRNGDPRHIYNYQIKTAKDFYSKLEKGYQISLQTLLEANAANMFYGELWGRGSRDRDEFEKLVNQYMPEGKVRDKLRELSEKYITTLPAEISGTKFCYLIKGKEEQDKELGFKVNTSPLIRGYKKVTTSNIEYAHSYWFPNPDNPSGKGRLGKGWESFNVWNSSGSGGSSGDLNIKSWIEMLYEGQVQRDAGYGKELLKKWCITPAEYYRDRDEIGTAIAETANQEKSIRFFVNYLSDQSEKLDPIQFSRNLDACYWIKGRECEFLPICHGKEWNTGKPVSEEVRVDPVGSGWYEERVEHHKVMGSDDGEDE